MKKLLQNVDLETLACALINCNASLRKKVMKYLSTQDQIRFEALSESLVKSKKTEINRCRQKLSSVINDLS
ncbi:MAG TPA: FliG C-terminal domain-containing protein [Bacteroidales bacterium]|nr:FliG C-terminal domain-containing protein [Bacteroidales bacterium]